MSVRKLSAWGQVIIVAAAMAAAAAWAAPFSVTYITTGSSSSCGVDCEDVTVGRVGNNYLSASCGYTNDIVDVKVNDPALIVAVTLIQVGFDDYLTVRLNGDYAFQEKGWDGNSARCGENRNRGTKGLSTDVTPYFSTAAPGSTVRLRNDISWRDKGDGWSIFRFQTRKAQCVDGADNDGDGRFDYPTDTGCSAASDDNEAGEPDCNDGLDNDGDGPIDFPADNGCASTIDTSEVEGPGPPGTPCPGCICNADLDGDGESDGQSEQTSCDQLDGGASCPLQRQACVIQNGARTCPVDPNAACLDTGGGTYMCSPNQCFVKGTTITENNDVNQPEPQDNGPRAADGSCLGTLKVFAGQGKRCRKGGAQTAWQNCCTNKMEKLNDTMGEKGGKTQRDYKDESSSIMFWDNQCDIQDQETSLLADSNYCVYLGEYCAERWVTGCVQRAKSYCCFNSMLSKMIQEQGRPQIPSMGGFGTPKSPSCGGFTLEQFQSLDFSKIDLSGYYSTFRFESQGAMKTKAQDNAHGRTGR